MGQKELSLKSGLSTKSCKRALEGLCDKEVIDLVKLEHSASRTGRTYRLVPYKEVKERWKARGYTHVIRKPGGGVDFCNADGVVIPVRPASTPAIQQLVESAKPKLGIVHRDNLSPHPGEKLSVTPGDNLTSPLDSSSEEITTDITTSGGIDPESIVQILTAYCGQVDDAAVPQLIARSQQGRPTLTASELTSALHMIGGQLKRAGMLVRNPIGWMTSRVPEYVADKAFGRREKYREIQREKALAEEAQTAMEMAIQEHLANLTKENEWTQILTYLVEAAAVDFHTCQTFLKPIKFFALEEKVLLLWLPLPEFAFVEKRFEIQIAGAIQNLGLDISKVHFSTTQELLALLPTNGGIDESGA